MGLTPDLTADGFPTNGPLVQNQMVFSLDITGETLTMNDITNVAVLFGTDGAPLIPEPGSVTLFTTGMLVVGSLIRRERRR